MPQNASSPACQMGAPVVVMLPRRDGRPLRCYRPPIRVFSAPPIGQRARPPATVRPRPIDASIPSIGASIVLPALFRAPPPATLFLPLHWSAACPSFRSRPPVPPASATLSPGPGARARQAQVDVGPAGHGVSDPLGPQQTGLATATEPGAARGWSGSPDRTRSVLRCWPALRRQPPGAGASTAANG